MAEVDNLFQYVGIHRRRVRERDLAGGVTQGGLLSSERLPSLASNAGRPPRRSYSLFVLRSCFSVKITRARWQSAWRRALSTPNDVMEHTFSSRNSSSERTYTSSSCRWGPYT